MQSKSSCSAAIAYAVLAHTNCVDGLVCDLCDATVSRALHTAQMMVLLLDFSYSAGAHAAQSIADADLFATGEYAASPLQVTHFREKNRLS